MNHPSDRHNYAADIKRGITDVRALCNSLGLTAGGPRTFAKQAAGLLVRCPVHQDRTPSCSVQLRRGVILWKCHGCDAGGDVLTLVAVVRGLKMRGADFREVLIETARVGGLWSVVDALERRSDSARASPEVPNGPPRAESAPEDIRTYPADAARFWGILEPVNNIPVCAQYLQSRAISSESAELDDLARAIPDRGALPTWARYRGQSWRDTGHRLVVPMWDASGSLRSVRGWRVLDNDTPKRLPPRGHKSAELVMADSVALDWLRGQSAPKRIVIAEGEPDYMTWATRLHDADTATIGIISGSWHQSLADKVPVGCRVDVRVDHDEAGDRYFADIQSSLRRRTPAVYRSMEAA